VFLVVLAAGCGHDPLTPAPPPNDPPLLASAAVFPDSVEAGSRVSLLAGAFDPDGDSLRVEWIVDGGELLTSEKGTLWEPPEAGGTYSARVVVTDPRGEKAQRDLTVTVLPRREPNGRPKIAALEADEETVPPFGSTGFRVEAGDPDGDRVAIRWAATGGRVLPQGDAMTWLAPGEQGIYTISVAAADDRGSTAVRTAVVRVHLDNDPPRILSVTSSEPRVRLGRGVTLSVEATDDDDDDAALTYTWRAGGGEFRGEGSTVLWIAPEGPACCAIGLYEIQVFVTDPRGGTEIGFVIVEVMQ
jgi:hypothetical protein